MRAHTVFFKRLISKRGSFYGLCGLIAFFVGANIVASHTYPSTMYEVMANNTSATVYYLQKINGTPLFDAEVRALEHNHNNEVLDRIQMAQTDKNTRIQHLKTMAVNYPYSPELLYNLAQLYKSENKWEEAYTYLQKAQAIDPSLR